MSLRPRLPRVCLFLLLALLGQGHLLAQKSAAGPPKTRTNNVKDVLYGVDILDAYRWLEDQDSPETRAWIDAQNAYTDSIFASLPGRGKLQARLTELLKTDSMGFPTERAGRYFFFKRAADQDLSVLFTRKGLTGADEVLIDPHPLSPDHRVSVTLLDVSEDGQMLLYGVRQGGEDELTLKLFDVDARRDLPDVLPRARYSGGSLTNDKTAIYYSRHTAAGPRAYIHAVGTKADADTQIFGDHLTPDKILNTSLSEDGHYVIFFVAHGSSANHSEIYFQNLTGKGPITPLINDVTARFVAVFQGDRAFIRTNWNAPNGRVLVADLKKPAKENWLQLVPERSGAVIDGMSAVGGKLFVRYSQNAVSRVEMFDPDGKRIREISFPTLGTVSGVGGRWASTEAFFSFTSFHVPSVIYRYDVASAERSEWFRSKVPVDSEKFDVKQVWYSSKDSTRVPMFLMHFKGLKLDGSHPVLLTGYGGFNLGSSPAFAARAVAWAEEGGVYALANLRGGNEFGEKWHQAGMREKKQNVFDDFIAAAEWLVANQYTTPSRLAISGGSNGGLLVGAAVTQRPDLFGAVVCNYPLLDMVRYHKFLVAKYWVPEYGSSDDPEQFRYIYAYSPYHRVKPGTKYPAVLFVSGDSDTRVAPLHARKMAALMQAATGSIKPVLLHYDTKAGHSGGRPIARIVADTVDELAFLFWQLEVKAQ